MASSWLGPFSFVFVGVNKAKCLVIVPSIMRHCASSKIMSRNFTWALSSCDLSVIMSQSHCHMWFKNASLLSGGFV